MSSVLIQIAIVLLCSAFFSAAEIAFVSSNKLLFELEKRKKNLTVRILNILFNHPSQYISSMLVATTVTLVIYGLLMSRLLTPFLVQFVIPDILIILIQILIAVFFILLLGEFIPKMLARINPNLFLSFFAVPLYIVYIILYPISIFISTLARFLLRIFGVRFSGIINKPLGREDLDLFIQKTIDESPQNADLDTEVRYFQNAMEFSQVKIRDCIVPRPEIVAVDKTTGVEELKNRFIETGLSKIIVYQDDVDNIVGYIHSSELFTKPDDWTQSINPLPFVPENMAANKLMKNMLAEKRSIAVVVDEFGGTSGIITLEDLVEEIFGEIEDEHDTNLYVAKQLGENEYIVSGRMEIDQVNEKFNLSIPESDDYMTIAGYILNHYQDFPKLNETITIDQFDFKIVKVTHTKIELVRLKVN